ncbi:MAG: TonB-dependent receptor plug domain-containing protein, partial [Pseudomonadota bacterium]|nr:TonB-dependent receptor plug domain-containing protein [Pseudomonadota bacterium]
MDVLKRTCIAGAVSFAVVHMGSAWAQENNTGTADKAAPATKNQSGLNLDQIVITGAPVGISKMKSSISVSTLSAEQLQLSAPTSAAEALRAVPGIRAESSGGEGNANLTVRGVPISAGGARYVQFQEDGLPLLQFGDFAFVTPDMFLRADNSLDHLEVVRGGSASTVATNSPGGILNFISKNGDEPGGSIGYSRGLGYDQSRYEFDYGNKVGPHTRMYVGGFYRKGEGIRTQGVTGEQGGQIKANLTQDFGNGFVRVSVKHLDDRTPTNLPVPVRTVNG